LRSLALVSNLPSDGVMIKNSREGKPYTNQSLFNMSAY